MEKKIIKYEQIKMLSVYALDPVGSVFEWEGRIFRLIKTEKIDYVKRLFDDGIIDEIVKRGYFIETKIPEDVVFETGEFIIEHKKLDYTILFPEMSWNMRKKLSCLALELNLYLLEHGYELQDPHYGNMGFEGTEARYLDLGSIKAINDIDHAYIGLSCIERTLYYPIMICKKRKEAFRILNKQYINGDQYFSYEDIGYHLGGIGGRIWSKIKIVQEIYRKTWKYFVKNDVSSKISGKKKFVYKLIKRICYKHDDAFYAEKYRKYNINKNKKFLTKLQKINFQEHDRWSNYQINFSVGGDFTTRQEWILNKIKDLEVSSVTEIAGNSGIMCAEALSRGIVKKALCTDYDTGALDIGMTKNNNKHLYYARLDITNSAEQSKKPRAERLHSDLVLAMAVTHHLILAQGYSVYALVNALRSLTDNYLIIEFMPKGLWDKTTSHEYAVPEWYTLDWFQESLSKCFNILEVKVLDTNRICIIAKVK